MLKAIPDSKWPTSKTGQTIVTYLTFTVALFSISPGGKTPWHGEAPNAAQWLLPARKPIKVWLWLQVTCSRYNSVAVQLWHGWVFFSDLTTFSVWFLIWWCFCLICDLAHTHLKDTPEEARNERATNSCLKICSGRYPTIFIVIIFIIIITIFK